VDEIGWVVADVAPETVISPPPGPPDPDLQRLLAELVRGQRPLPVDGRPPPDISGAVETFMLWTGRVLGGALLLAFLITVLGRIYRRLGAVVARQDHRRVYLAALDALSSVGIRRAYGESREAFARRVATELPSFTELTAGHVGARFGHAGAKRGDPSALFRALRTELRKAVPVWRRAVGILSPWTWLLSR
jgi:hypothetical protein